MKQKLLKYLLGLVILTSLYDAVGQTNFTLYNMSAIPQVHSVNPGIIPQNRLNIGLPGISGIYTSLSNSGFTLSEALRINEQGNTVVDVDNLKNVLAETNFLTNRLEVDLFNLGFRVGNNYFRVGARNINQFLFKYPKDAFVFLAEGNGQSFLGERASFDGLGIDFENYNEYSLGYSRRVSERLQVGATYKYLYGIANLYTRQSQFGIETTNDFDIIIDGAFEVNSSGLDSTGLARFNNFDAVPFLFQGQNTGFAIDLGATYKVTQNLILSASMIDFGRINWRENTASFTQSEANFIFSGLDLGSILGVDSANVNAGSFDFLQDSLFNQIDVQQTDAEYVTPLSTKFFIGAKYNLTSRIQLSALTFNQVVRGSFRTSASFGVNTSVGNFLTLSANYSAYGRSLGNLGAGASINLGPIQFYILTDNVLAPLNFDNRKNFHLRFGLNLTFDRDYEYQ